MRQAIEEGFILDVLKNYTVYSTYYRLLKSAQADPEVEKKKAAKALARFMRLHPTTSPRRPKSSSNTFASTSATV